MANNEVENSSPSPSKACELDPEKPLAANTGGSAKDDPGFSKREWLATTAFPLVSGTFGPIATAFNICALVYPWRYRISKAGGQETHKRIGDPEWLLAVNVVSLVSGTAANLCILTLVNPRTRRFRNRSFDITCVSCVCGIIASLSLVGILAIASTRLRREGQELSWTGAFYFAIIAASLYFVVSLMMMHTTAFLRRERKRGQDKGDQILWRVKSHHKLMLLAISFMTYILAGAGLFAHLEGWKYLDAVYWADVTVLTIGFGDFSPMTSLGRRLMLPYAVCGICILGLTVYCISALMIDEGRTVWRDLYMHKALKRAQDRRHAERTSEKRSGKQSPQDLDVNPERQERRLREQDFKRMRDIVRSLIRQFMWWSVVILALLWVSLLLLGATVFWKAERAQDWSYFQAIYFALNALLVIGYGDLLLQSEGGKAFFVVWSLIAVPIVTALISATARAAGQMYLQEKNGPKGPLLRRWSTWSSQKQEVQRLPHNVISEINMTMDHGDLPHSRQDKNRLLIQAVKRIAHSHVYKHRADYEFDDWEFIFYLIGALNNPPLANGTKTRPGRQAKLPKRPLSTFEDWQKASDGGIDWLNPKNPLYNAENVTAWIMMALVEGLQKLTV